MKQLRRVPITTLVITVGAVSTIAWITMEGPAPLVISILATALIALRATLADDEE